MQRDRVHSVDILRGLLAVGVMLYHYSYWLGLNLPQPLLSISHKVGIYAVESFFVLSGFSLYYAYRNRPPLSVSSFLMFLRARMLRLAPLFALGILLSKEVHLAQIALLRSLSNFTLTFGFVDSGLSLIVGGWSIGVEVVLSVLLPALLFAQIRLRHWFLIVVALACIPFYLFQGERLYIQAPNHILFFVAGVYFGFLRERASMIPTKAFWLFLVAFGIMFCGIDADATGWQELVTGGPRVALTIATLGIAAAFCLYDFKEIPFVFPALTLIGEGSYSVYLLHPIVYERLVGPLSFAPKSMIYFAIATITIILSVVVYHYFETPVMKWLKNGTSAVSLPAKAYD